MYSASRTRRPPGGGSGAVDTGIAALMIGSPSSIDLRSSSSTSSTNFSSCLVAVTNTSRFAVDARPRQRGDDPRLHLRRGRQSPRGRPVDAPRPTTRTMLSISIFLRRGHGPVPFAHLAPTASPRGADGDARDLGRAPRLLSGGGSRPLVAGLFARAASRSAGALRGSRARRLHLFRGSSARSFSSARAASPPEARSQPCFSADAAVPRRAARETRRHACPDPSPARLSSPLARFSGRRMVCRCGYSSDSGVSESWRRVSSRIVRVGESRSRVGDDWVVPVSAPGRDHAINIYLPPTCRSTPGSRLGFRHDGRLLRRNIPRIAARA